MNLGYSIRQKFCRFIIFGSFAVNFQTIALADSKQKLFPKVAPINYFDPSPSTTKSYNFRIVGSKNSKFWGRIELLEGLQNFRTEGYNQKTAKMRYVDTFSSSTYPIQQYFGKLNQEIVDGFNLYYNDKCASGKETCISPSPTMPEARFALLHWGPQTVRKKCFTERPVLLLHGAMQNANAWLWPFGKDDKGSYSSPNTPVTGLVASLENDERCVFALTFGNFHGDNLTQAIHIANAISYIKQQTYSEKVDVVAWSKSAFPLSLYMSNPAKWSGWSNRFFEQITKAQAKQIPEYRQDVGNVVTLAGSNLGLDFNWRHPHNNLININADYNIPIGQGPVMWSFFAPIQCPNWGITSIGNTVVGGLCKGRGGSWIDFWKYVYFSNLTGLDGNGYPIAKKTLQELNPSSDDFYFEKYNLALWGSVDESGIIRTAYNGQLQLTYDFRPFYPILSAKTRCSQEKEADSTLWFAWLKTKLAYNPYGFITTGHMNNTLEECREATFGKGTCTAFHMIPETKESADQLFSYNHPLFGGLSIETASEIGGNLVQKLIHNGISSHVDSVSFFYGNKIDKNSLFVSETDGLQCDSSETNSDSVIFYESANAANMITRNWSTTAKLKIKSQKFEESHLSMGTSNDVFNAIITQLKRK